MFGHQVNQQVLHLAKPKKRIQITSEMISVQRSIELWSNLAPSGVFLTKDGKRTRRRHQTAMGTTKIQTQVVLCQSKIVQGFSLEAEYRAPLLTSSKSLPILTLRSTPPREETSLEGDLENVGGSGEDKPRVDMFN